MACEIKRDDDIMKKEPIVKNAIRCSICGAPADRYDMYFQCQKNPNHCADIFVGIFTDLERKEVTI